MSESNLDAFQRELALRKVRSKGRELLNGQERYDFHGIQDKYDRQREETEFLYRSEYALRVDVAYQMLMRQAGSKKPELKPRSIGADKFSPNKLKLEAQKLVRFEHERTMARIDQNELKESRAFLEKSSQRRAYIDAFTEKAKQSKSEHPARNPSPTLSD